VLNRVAKFILVSTALSPVLGAVAVNQYALGKEWTAWVPWLSGAVLLGIICWLLLTLVAKTCQVQQVKVKEFERDDKEVVGFLLAYLLPFLSSKDMAFEGQWLTGLYVLFLLVVVFAHAGSLHFNPVMGLLGYHFYSVKDDGDGPKLFITKLELQRPGETYRVAMLGPCICVHLPEKK
jgi:hypothetical protein